MNKERIKKKRIKKKIEKAIERMKGGVWGKKGKN